MGISLVKGVNYWSCAETQFSREKNKAKSLLKRRQWQIEESNVHKSLPLYINFWQHFD